MSLFIYFYFKNKFWFRIAQFKTFKTLDEMISRGCIKDLEQNDLEKCQNKVEWSSLCLENGCNDQIVKTDRYCYECDSETDPNCAGQINNSMLKRCPNSEQDLGCFHMIKGIIL